MISLTLDTVLLPAGQRLGKGATSTAYGAVHLKDIGIINLYKA